MKRILTLTSLLFLVSFAYGASLVSSNYGWCYGRFGYECGMNQSMTWWTVPTYEKFQRVTEVKTTVFCESGYYGTMVVNFYATKVTTPIGVLVGSNLIGTVSVPITIPAMPAVYVDPITEEILYSPQIVSTGDISNSNIILPSGYFGVETHFISGNPNVEIAVLSGMSGGEMDWDFYLDDNYDGWLTNNEVSNPFAGFLSPTVEVFSVYEEGVSFTGTVNLLGWMGDELPPIRVWVDNQDFFWVDLIRVDNDTGTFTIPLTVGVHIVRVKAEKSLSASLEVTVE